MQVCLKAFKEHHFQGHLLYSSLIHNQLHPILNDYPECGEGSYDVFVGAAQNSTSQIRQPTCDLKEFKRFVID